MLPLRVLLALSAMTVGFANAQTTPRSQDRPAAPLFTAIPPGESGVTMRHPLLADHPHAFLYTSGFACGSVSIGDVNGDDRPDLFFTAGPEPNRLYLQTETPLQFRDATGEARFSGPVPQSKPWAGGAALVDLNRDGHLDIYICNYDAPNQLYINNGAARFSEQARDWNLDIVDASLFPAFMDIDGSGELALYLLTNRYERPGGRPQRPPVVYVDGKPRIAPEFEKYYGLKQSGPNNYHVDFVGRPDRLLLPLPLRPPLPLGEGRGEGSPGEGRGEGELPQATATTAPAPSPQPLATRRYRDVSREAGITPEGGHGLSATWFDYDGDARPDLYVGNDFADPDCLYHNEGKTTEGIVRFKNTIAGVMPITTWSSMGADAADINNDGLMDLIVGDMASRTHAGLMINTGELGDRLETLLNSWPRQTMRNMLYLNAGTGRFLETAYLSGIAQTDWTWAVKLADFDNDGRVDLFVTNGVSRNFTDADAPFTTEMYIGHTDWDLRRSAPPRKEKNLAYRNLDGSRFEDVSEAWGVDHPGMSYAAAYGDLDNDGDLDLVVCNLDETVSIYRNDCQKDRHWLEVRLRGTASHSHGWGASVRVKTASGWRVRQMNPATGFLSCNDPHLHFGLGADSTIEQVEVQWPSGRFQRIERTSVDQLLTLTEPAADSVVRGSPDPAPAGTSPTLFTGADNFGLDFRHQEQPYDDYAREPLLPGKLSQLGPGIAVGDANGDGNDDIYFGGAAGQAGALYVKGDDDRFARVAGPWEAHSDREDMGALWFDADGDGRLDLYVVSGGVEGLEGDDIFQDRLYLNDTPPDGTVRFRPSAQYSVPDARHNGSAVCAADFDRDGDSDLFVGSRSIPGRYPQTPRSLLLRNDSTPGQPKFADLTDDVAPGLAAAGLVSGALWSDVDADGYSDLLVTSEWGPVKLFHNRRGKLTDETKSTGLAQRFGWWNGIAPGDFDADGRIDYLVTNVGLNTKYGTPTSSNPAMLYAGDMGSSGGYQIIEARLSQQVLLPVRARSAITTAMPQLARKFPTYRAYAAARLTDMFAADTLRQNQRLAANEFRSGVLYNRSTPGKPAFEWQPLPDIVQIAPCYGIAVADFSGDGRPDAAMAQNHFTREPETGLWRGGLSQLLASAVVRRFPPVVRGSPDPAPAPVRLQPVPSRASGIVIPGDAKGVACIDLDGDARPDLLVAQNNDAAIALRNQLTRPSLALRLVDRRGAPAIGARVITHFADGSRLASELCAGSGYLSQSSPEIYLGLGSSAPERAEIHWPSGKVQTVDLKGRSGRLTLKALTAHGRVPTK